MRIFCLALLVVVFPANGIFAQASTPEPLPTAIYVGERVMHNAIFWLPASNILAFDASGVRWDYGAYDVSTGVLTELDRPALTVTLTPEQGESLEAASDWAFVAHDGRRVIYESRAAMPGEGNPINLWAIGDLETGEFAVLKIGAMNNIAVRWSDDSSAALLTGAGYYGGMASVFYIGGFTKDINAAYAFQMSILQTLNDAFVDFAPDGSRALLREQGNGYDTGLYLWDANEPERVVFDMPVFLEDARVTGAAFDTADRDTLYVVLEGGIARYSISTGKTKILNPAINATWINWSHFSPDRKYIAVIPRRGDTFPCKIFVLPFDLSGDVQAMLDAEKCIFSG